MVVLAMKRVTYTVHDSTVLARQDQWHERTAVTHHNTTRDPSVGGKDDGVCQWQAVSMHVFLCAWC